MKSTDWDQVKERALWHESMPNIIQKFLIGMDSPELYWTWAYKLHPWRFLVKFLLTPKFVLIYRNKRCTSHTIPVEMLFSTLSGCMPE